MSDLAEVMATLAELGPRGLSRFQAGLDPEWIAEGLEATGTASVRKRRFPAEYAVWLVIGIALFADRSIYTVSEDLGLVTPGNRRISPSSIAEARYRLGPDPMEWLFKRVSSAWSTVPGVGGYRGLSLFGVDGSHLRVPDSEANLEHFGKPGGRGGEADSGYPQMRLCLLMNLDTRLLAAASFGPFAKSEQALAAELWSSLPDNSLTILDRGFVNYRVLSKLASSEKNRHFMVRLRSDMKYERLELLPDGSEIALLRPCSAALREEPDIAPTLKVRIIRYQNPGGVPSRLCVTLLDWEQYPAAELTQLYHQRWELEVGYDELKTHMLHRKESLRSMKPEGIAQEMWGILLAYNLVRREMMLVAVKNKVAPNRISFWTSLLRIRDFWVFAALTRSPGNIPARLADMERDLQSLILPPRRSHRRYPRHVKIKMSRYPRNRGRAASKAIEQPEETP